MLTDGGDFLWECLLLGSCCRLWWSLWRQVYSRGKGPSCQSLQKSDPWEYLPKVSTQIPVITEPSRCDCALIRKVCPPPLSFLFLRPLLRADLRGQSSVNQEVSLSQSPSFQYPGLLALTTMSKKGQGRSIWILFSKMVAWTGRELYQYLHQPTILVVRLPQQTLGWLRVTTPTTPDQISDPWTN